MCDRRLPMLLPATSSRGSPTAAWCIRPPERLRAVRLLYGESGPDRERACLMEGVWRNLLAASSNALGGELGMNAWRSIGAVRAASDLPDGDRALRKGSLAHAR